MVKLQREAQIWSFVALDPVGAWQPGEYHPRTIRDTYESEGTALFRLYDFAQKRGVQVRARLINNAKRLRDRVYLHDCRFRWPDGKPGYATVIRVVPGRLTTKIKWREDVSAAA